MQNPAGRPGGEAGDIPNPHGYAFGLAAEGDGRNVAAGHLEEIDQGGTAVDLDAVRFGAPFFTAYGIQERAVVEIVFVRGGIRKNGVVGSGRGAIGPATIRK